MSFADLLRNIPDDTALREQEEQEQRAKENLRKHAEVVIRKALMTQKEKGRIPGPDIAGFFGDVTDGWHDRECTFFPASISEMQDYAKSHSMNHIGTGTIFSREFPYLASRGYYRFDDPELIVSVLKELGFKDVSYTVVPISVRSTESGWIKKTVYKYTEWNGYHFNFSF